MLLAEQQDLIVTLPSKFANLQKDNPNIAIMEPPFDIPEFELKMAWSPLLHNNPAHRWMRNLINEIACECEASTQIDH